ncbi:MAG: TIGR02221 family CRISPR-associated protein [Caloramator sp.]|nr:TIGR02221 family CRISPR-associated protein [Caloramator sp.]
MSKILITGIGTGRTNEVKKSDGSIDLASKREYENITYIIEDKEYNTAFVAKALIQHYDIDKVFFIGTAGSMWEEIYKSYKKNFDEDTYFEIASKIEKSDYQNYLLTEDDLKAVEEAIDESLGHKGSRCFLIKYGLNEQKLFYNFKIMQKIEELLEDNDEIYLDITHSFRSLSLFQYVMINFAQNLSSKNLKVNGVFYGMLEAKRYYNNKAPVVNLSKVYEISNWINAIHELDKYGNGYLVSELLEKYDNKLSKK